MKFWCGSILLLAPALWGQSNASDGALSGYVRDESNAMIAGAALTARHLQTNTEVKALSNEDGYYRFPL